MGDEGRKDRLEEQEETLREKKELGKKKDEDAIGKERGRKTKWVGKEE